MRLRTALTLALCCSTPASAADLAHSTLYHQGPRTAANDATPTGFPVCLTQSADNTQLVAGSIACQSGGVTTDNGYIRVYDLDELGPFTQEFRVDYTVELSQGDVELTINLYAVPNGTDITAGLGDPTCSTSLVQPDGELLFESVEVPDCFGINGLESDVVVEVRSEDCLETSGCEAFFPGSNNLGETAPSYIVAPDCGIETPLDLTTVGFPMNVWVLDLCVDNESFFVPAGGPLGALVTILALGAASGAVLRRRLRTNVPGT